MKILIGLIFIFHTFLSFAVDYTENLYLCDLGIKNSNTSNQLGVDFIEYFQSNRNLSVNAGINFNTASNYIQNYDPAFSLWLPNYAIDNASINLETDFYGSQYFLQYCYTWDRTIPPNNNGTSISSTPMSYNVTFNTSIMGPIPMTQVSGVTDCSILSSAGYVNQVTSQTLDVINSLSSDSISMRCTIKINFIEDTFGGMRPHNGGVVDINPIVNVSVGL